MTLLKHRIFQIFGNQYFFQNFCFFLSPDDDKRTAHIHSQTIKDLPDSLHNFADFIRFDFGSALKFHCDLFALFGSPALQTRFFFTLVLIPQRIILFFRKFISNWFLIVV